MRLKLILCFTFDAFKIKDYSVKCAFLAFLASVLSRELSETSKASFKSTRTAKV